MRRTELKRSAMKRKPTSIKRSRRKKPVVGVNGFTKEDWQEEGVRQRVCQVTGRRSGWNGPEQEGQPWQGHHVLYEQIVRREGGDIFDPRNCMRLATFIHKKHHDGTDYKIPARCLSDANIEFAFELLGAGAHPFFRRYYEGFDTRIESALAELAGIAI